MMSENGTPESRKWSSTPTPEKASAGPLNKCISILVECRRFGVAGVGDIDTLHEIIMDVLLTQYCDQKPELPNDDEKAPAEENSHHVLMLDALEYYAKPSTWSGWLCEDHGGWARDVVRIVSGDSDGNPVESPPPASPSSAGNIRTGTTPIPSPTQQKITEAIRQGKDKNGEGE